MQDLLTQRSNSDNTPACSAPMSNTPGRADDPDTAKLDTLRQRVNAMLDQPLPKEGDAFPLPDALTLGTNSEASTR